MTERGAVTMDELHARIRSAGLSLPEARQEMVRQVVATALAPVRRMDGRALATLEPAVRFDAGSREREAPGTTPATGGSARARAAAVAGPGASDQDLWYLGIRELAARFRRRALSPVELTTALLARIERLQPTLHAFVTLTAERALADAKAAEAAIMRGDSGPLVGIPIAYKDLYATRGIRTTAGSAVLADWIPAEDSTCVARLQAAGCVMLGKLITHEFALGIQFPGHRFLPARNPWNTDHIPRGSSSGSGAALAAGLTVTALGSDTGGSIRGPASACGIVGLKPTYGRCSRAGVVTLSWTLDHTGPMARTVEDCAFLLQGLAGVDPADPASSHVPVDNYVTGLGQGIEGLRVGIPRAYFFDGVQAEVIAAFDRAVETLRHLGARVEDVEIPSILDSPVYAVIMLAEAFAYHERDLRERPALYGDVLRERFMAGGLFTAGEYVQAQRLRERVRHDTLAALTRVDVLLTPTAVAPAAPPPSTSLDFRRSRCRAGFPRAVFRSPCTSRGARSTRQRSCASGTPTSRPRSGAGAVRPSE